MVPKRFLIGTVAALVISALNGSGLEWETKRISIVATHEQESAEGIFAFTNNSDQTVTIKSVRSSCGCTVPELEKREFQPAESGEIKALFTFGTRTGAQRKSISVVTDEPDQEEPRTIGKLSHLGHGRRRCDISCQIAASGASRRNRYQSRYQAETSDACSDG